MRGSGVYSETSQRSDADEISRIATDGQQIGGTVAKPPKPRRRSRGHPPTEKEMS
jgi:hypothetical protein